ncbi:hypothetical protein RHD99_07770 [Buttiauxella selenatireducens]|uniref:Uncharacterized protein n=1 Tax=Buttiauxella selenatireducens TaxID=3073902 RepID=A0ABY9SEA6_9ENTR|nr:hypothetical protein [Buttiauxella sp. R73]WMY75827.1 hypothetical protein RHD99_07770 [Buttiauxella sp. R73]
MNIKFQDHVFQALLAEANRQNKPMARLCHEILATAASIFDNAPTIPNEGTNQNGDTNDRDGRN